MSIITRQRTVLIGISLCLILILFSTPIYFFQPHQVTQITQVPQETNDIQASTIKPVKTNSDVETNADELISTTRGNRALVSFTNVTPKVGLSGVSGNFFAWGDYNNDGNQDLLVNGGRLFRNNGPNNYTFTEVTSEVGLSGGGNGAWADYNNDGYLDLYCTGNDILWHNQGPPLYNFKDVTIKAGNISNDYPTTAVGWGDYDLDGYLDLYIANGEDWNDGNPIYYPDFLYHNNGNGTFTDVTEQSGIRNFGGPYYGRGVAWGDFDNNGWPDVYISNYRISENWLFFNNRNGTFTNVAHSLGVTGEESQRMGNTYYGHTVGSAWADLDNDDDLDLFESNLVHKDLYRGPICGDSQIYRNNGPENDYTFTDVRESSEVPEKNIGGGEDELYVGIAMGDFDNDGFQDFFIPQIYDLEYSYSYLYHNNGDWTFSNVSDEVGILVWNTYGGAWCDYNNDGFIDLITGGKGSADPNATYEVHLYRNGGNTNSWLQIKLTGGHYNQQGIGVRVKVTGNGFSQIREVEGGMGCHSMQNSIPLEFGFGSYSDLVEVDVYWPSGFKQHINDVFLNQILEIEEPILAPDLLFINAKVKEEHPIQGDEVTLEASVANMGYMDVYHATVTFYDGNPSLSPSTVTVLGTPQEIFDLDKFHSIKVFTTWDTTGYAGKYDIWAVIEDVEPKELIITNNTFNFSCEIREENELPVAILTATPTEDLLPGAIVNFQGSNSTDDIRVDYFNFNFGDGNSSGWVINSEVKHQYQSSGKFMAELTVKDSDGDNSINSAKVEITIGTLPPPNRPPVINSYSANPKELNPSESSNLKVIASDPDDDEMTYHFSASGGKLSTNIHNSGAIWKAPETEGVYTISVKVSDGELFSNEESIDIAVIRKIENYAPEITEIIISEPEINPKNSTTIKVLANDPNPDDVLSYSYEVIYGRIIGTGPEVSWVAPELPGVYSITVTVTDTGGLYSEKRISITVIEVDYPPEILDAFTEPSTIGNDESTLVLFSVEVSDLNGLDDVYRVTIDLSIIEGDNKQKMYDNGRHGDERANDGIYSYEYVVPEGLEGGTKRLEIIAEDYTNNEDQYELILEIQASKNDTDSGSGLPGFETHLFLICLVSLIVYLFIFARRKSGRE